MTANLCVVAETASCATEADAIAQQLGVEVKSAEAAPGAEFQLLVSEQGLALRKSESNQTPLQVDFNSSQFAYRRRHSSKKNEMIARAVGLGKGNVPRIVDATAGLGKDSFILATLGCPVVMLERSAVIAMLLADGLKRAGKIPALADVAQRMSLYPGEAIDWIQQQESLEGRVVYLDPMFPAKSGSALSRGDMQFMQGIVGKDGAFEELFLAARKANAERVVLKRPLRADGAAVKPSFSLKGKSSRFDVYLRLH